ncbi:F-box-like protein [Ceratobasidium sp. AG-Ba]|nr:F-box-like protein [Ceratobasidium sp. AG-Ba]
MLDLLSDSVQKCLDSSLALEVADTQSFMDTPGYDNVLNKLLTAVDAERILHEQIVTKLDKAFTSIKRFRNRIAKVVPAVKLPQEILVYIFETASAEPGPVTNRQKYITDTKTLFSISHVSSYWRYITVNTPTLWSRIDVDIVAWRGNRIPEKHRALIERASNIPLYANFLLGQGRFPTELIPLLNRASSLNLGAFSCFGLANIDPLEDALTCWITNGPSNSVKKLTIDGNFPVPIMRHLSLGRFKLQAKQHLYSIQVLRLRHVSFEWSSPVYHGLVHLELCDIFQQQRPTFQQLAYIFAACPDLRVLKLASIHALDVSYERSSTPSVALHKLELLDIAHMPHAILNLIDPGPNSLTVRISMSLTPLLPSPVTDFLKRSNTTSLYVFIGALGEIGAIHEVLGATKSLHELTLDYSNCPRMSRVARQYTRSGAQRLNLNILRIIVGCFPVRTTVGSVRR